MGVSIDKELAALDKNMTALRIDYDRYFVGDVKLQPFDRRRKVDAEFRRLTNLDIEKTAERFRLQSLQAKYNSMVEVWEKKIQAREEGRGVFARNVPRDAVKEPPPPPVIPGVGDSSDRKSAPSVEGGKRRVDFTPLFNRYVAAREALGEDISKLRYERFEELIKKQAEEIKRKTGSGRLVFEVQTVEGKVRLVGRSAPPKATKGTEGS